jgi:hypothetical protein
MSYNPNLSYFLSRLQGVSTNYFRIEAQTGTSATSNKILRFSLPSNCLLNTKSLALMLTADANGVASKGGRLPAGINGLIDRVELSSGGQQISQGFNGYGVYKRAKDNLCGYMADAALGHPEIVRAKSYVDGAGDFAAGSASVGIALATTQNENYNADSGSVQFAIKDWEGFLGTVSPSIIDTSLLNDCVLSIYLAGNEVLSSSGGVGLDGAGSGTDITDAGALGATFNVKNFHLLVETLGLADASLDEMVARRISDVGYIEMAYKQYYSFSDSHTGNTRYSVSTQSLDRVWTIWRDASYDTQAAPKTVNGYKTSALTTGQYDQGALDTDREKYVGVFFNFKERATTPATPPLYQHNFNGSMFPQVKCTAEQMLHITKNSLPTYDQHKRVKHDYSLDQYKNNYFTQCIRLCLPESEETSQISGVDTRGIALNAYLATSGLASGAGVMIICETTATIRVGANRAMEIIS